MRTTAKQLQIAVDRLREITGKNYILRYRDSRVGGYGVCIQHDKERGYSQEIDDFSGSAAEVYTQLWAAIRILENYKQEQAEKPASFLSVEVNCDDKNFDDENFYIDTPKGLKDAIEYAQQINQVEDEDSRDFTCIEVKIWRWEASKEFTCFVPNKITSWNADPNNKQPQTPTFNLEKDGE